jgi:hypothetical protein
MFRDVKLSKIVCVMEPIIQKLHLQQQHWIMQDNILGFLWKKPFFVVTASDKVVNT